MMDFNQLIDSITPEIYENLTRAIETGKWPNNVPLSGDQREQCLQAVIAYDLRHKNEQERVGFIHTKKHTHCGSDGDEADAPNADEPMPLKWDN